MSNFFETAQMTRVNHVSFSHCRGGAAIAAHRLHRACVAAGQSSRMTVADSATDALIDQFPMRRTLRRTVQREWARHLRRKYAPAQTDGLVSLAYPRSGLAAHLNAQSQQVINLHWVQGDMISVAEIGALRHPVVWTLHDMWPFCGAEHYTEGDGWKDGYASDETSGFDLNRWVWQRKAHSWKVPRHIICPSRWLADCVRKSRLMRDWPVHVIPNALDTGAWAPVPKEAARAALNLPADVPLVAFGAMGGDADPRKGFDHLMAAMRGVRQACPDVAAIVFGNERDDVDAPFPIHYMGSVSDETKLRQIYSSADVFALPSRQDNLPNTGVEALACGVPVVGFDIGGLPDLVPNTTIGYLARPFDEADLAQGIAGILLNRDGDAGATMSAAARAHAVASYAAPVVAAQYGSLYETLQHAAD